MSTKTPGGVIDLPIGSLGNVRIRRFELRDAMDLLESQAARPSGSERWLGRVVAALAAVDVALDSHVAEVDGDDGLLAEVVAEAPHLSRQAEELRADHHELKLSWERARAECTADSPDPIVIRRRITSLLGRLAVHRQLGSEILYDAYNIDIGAAD